MTLGKIVIDDGTLTATLEDDGRWRCDNEAIKAYLNSSFDLQGWYGSPSMGMPGMFAIKDAAEELGGTWEYLAEIQSSNDPDAVW